MAEGAPLLREYRVKSLIEGSNPSLSASLHKALIFQGFFVGTILRSMIRMMPVAGSHIERRHPIAAIKNHFSSKVLVGDLPIAQCVDAVVFSLISFPRIDRSLIYIHF